MTPAAATLVFSYEQRTATLVELIEEREPQAYDLCEPHAARTSPPRDWEMVDQRPVRMTHQLQSFDDEDGTIAVLAGVLHAAPDAAEAPEEVADTGEVLLDEAPPEEGRAGAGPGGQDPLRAALQEVLRVVEPEAAEGSEPEAASAPVPDEEQARRRVVVIVDGDDPEAEPTLW